MRPGVTALALVCVTAAAVLFISSAMAAASITYTITAGTPGNNGWYLTDVTVAIQTPGATDTTCPSVRTFRSTSDVLDCTAKDGNSTISFHLSFKIDKDKPTVTGASPDRGPNGNGWFNAPVTVTFAGTDATSGIASCTQTGYGGPDSGGTGVTGTCTDVAGNQSAPSTYSLKYDSTPPTVSPSPDRNPDSNGWYNHPVTVTFAGTDATSGIDSCTPATYSGPDSGTASVSGTCRDLAGNVTTASFGLKYDATPPKLSGLAASDLDQGASLTWKPSADIVKIVVTRRAGEGKSTTVYDGKPLAAFTDKHLRNGVRYAYTVTGFDIAGNEATEKTTADPSPPLFAPRAHTQVHAGVVLRWRPAPRATYYNLQLWLGGVKVLSTWPLRPSFRLPGAWTFLGRSYRLAPGRYSWFVWPGRGARARHAFGALLGTSTFVVTR